jgi:hypothetical protein
MAAGSLSLYTKAGASGNRPPGRCKASKRKELAEGRGRGARRQLYLLTIVVITSIMRLQDPGGGP